MKWVKSTNDKYGIMIYQYDAFNAIFTVKTAKTIHKRFKERYERAVMMRVCSENINYMGKEL